jgi:hypothetical protein
MNEMVEKLMRIYDMIESHPDETLEDVKALNNAIKIVKLFPDLVEALELHYERDCGSRIKTVMTIQKAKEMMGDE